MAAIQRNASDPLPTREVTGRVVQDPDCPSAIISYGLPFEQALVNHLNNSMTADQAARVYLIASKSLITNTDALIRLESTLGSRLVGRRIGLKSHTQWNECLDVVADVKKTGATCLVALGGSSIGDGAKFIAMAALHPLETFEQLEPYIIKHCPTLDQPVSSVDIPCLPIISIPTTLSAGEHTPGIGFTDSTTALKYQLYGPRPEFIIYDSYLSLATPERLWLSSGIRSFDHAVESLCAINTLQILDDTAARALRLLVPGLIRSFKDPADVQARLNCQLGASLAIMPICRGLPMGASHAIGHMLGPLGVGHGETSCILLPAVCKWNMPANTEKQKKALEVLKSIPEVAALALESKLQDDAHLADYLDLVIRALAMPRSLKDVGIIGDDKLRDLATRAMKDVWIPTNPRKISGPEDVMQILEIVRG